MADGKPSILIYRDTLRLLLNSFGPEDFYACLLYTSDAADEL